MLLWFRTKKALLMAFTIMKQALVAGLQTTIHETTSHNYYFQPVGFIKSKAEYLATYINRFNFYQWKNLH